LLTYIKDFYNDIAKFFFTDFTIMVLKDKGEIMQVNYIQNTKPSFKASLKIYPKGVHHYGSTKPYDYEDLPLNDLQLKTLKSKFEKATKDIKGTLTVSLGQYNVYNDSYNYPSNISYMNGKYKDSIPVIIGPQSLTTKNEFVDKLVKMLEIFKFREKNSIRVQQMEQRIAELNQSTRASSLGAAETLFKMPEWRNNRRIK